MRVKWAHGDPEAHSMSSRVFRSAFHFATSDVWDLRLCVLELYLIYCTLYLIHFRISFLLCCDAFCSLFFCWGLLSLFLFLECENWFKIVVCHSASSQQQFRVCNVCERESELYAAAEQSAKSASGRHAFYLSTGEKPDSIKRVTEITSHSFLFLESKHFPTTSWLRQQNVPLCCKTFSSRRSL